MDFQRGVRRARRRASSARARGAAPRELPPARLGRQPPALLGLPDPGDLLREVRRRAGAGRPAAGRAAGRRRVHAACNRRSRPIPSGARRPARSAAARPSARPTPSTPSWSRAGTTRATPRRARPTWSTSAPTTGCRSTSTSAASSTRSCTCCTSASITSCCATRAWCTATSRRRNLLCQGMVIAETFYRDERGRLEGLDQSRPTSRSSAMSAAASIGATLKRRRQAGA